MTGWLLPLAFAPVAGSVLGVLDHRLPRGEPVALARSRCEACGHALGPAELVPLLSFAWLGGRCRWCRARIALRHPGIELACLGIAGWAVLAGPDPWASCVLGWILLALAWIDWDHLVLPDVLTLPLAAAGLGATWWLDPGALPSHAAAASAGYLAFRGVEVAYRRWRGRDGLGQGDAKLLAAAGAWVGPEALPTVVFVAALCGLATAAILRLAGRPLDSATAIPFGPAICAALWAVWLGFDPIGTLLRIMVE